MYLIIYQLVYHLQSFLSDIFVLYVDILLLPVMNTVRLIFLTAICS